MQLKALVLLVIFLSACEPVTGHGKEASCTTLAKRLSSGLMMPGQPAGAASTDELSKKEESAAKTLQRCLDMHRSSTDVEGARLQVGAFYQAAAEHAATARDFQRANILIRKAVVQLQLIDASKLDKSEAIARSILLRRAHLDEEGKWYYLM